MGVSVTGFGGQLPAVLLVVGLLAAGCAAGESEPEPLAGLGDAGGTEDVTAGADLEPSADAITSAEDPAVQDAVLLTAVDEVLATTAYADAVDEDPGPFLLTATSLCEALDDGAEPAAVLAGFLTTLRDAGLELDDDAAHLAGALYGAAVEVRCPQHTGRLEESP